MPGMASLRYFILGEHFEPSHVDEYVNYGREQAHDPLLPGDLIRRVPPEQLTHYSDACLPIDGQGAPRENYLDAGPSLQSRISAASLHSVGRTGRDPNQCCCCTSSQHPGNAGTFRSLDDVGRRAFRAHSVGKQASFRAHIRACSYPQHSCIDRS